MKPAWDQLAGKLAKAQHVQVADVDCTAEANQGLCQKQGVQGYPTIKYYVAGNKAGNDYKGGRDYKSLYGHVRKMASVRKKKAAKDSESKMDIDAVIAKMKEQADTETIGKAFISWVETNKDADKNMKKMLKSFEMLKNEPGGYAMMGEVFLTMLKQNNENDATSKRMVKSFQAHLDTMIAEKQEL